MSDVEDGVGDVAARNDPDTALALAYLTSLVFPVVVAPDVCCRRLLSVDQQGVGEAVAAVAVGQVEKGGPGEAPGVELPELVACDAVEDGELTLPLGVAPVDAGTCCGAGVLLGRGEVGLGHRCRWSSIQTSRRAMEWTSEVGPSRRPCAVT